VRRVADIRLTLAYCEINARAHVRRLPSRHQPIACRSVDRRPSPGRASARLRDRQRSPSRTDDSDRLRDIRFPSFATLTFAWFPRRLAGKPRSQRVVGILLTEPDKRDGWPAEPRRRRCGRRTQRGLRGTRMARRCAPD
jgi:hypothetical protein